MNAQQLKGTITANGKHYGIVTLPIEGEEVGAVMQLGKVAGQGAKVVGFFTEVHPFDTDRFSIWVNKAGRIIVSSEAVVRVTVGEPAEKGIRGLIKKAFTPKAARQTVVAASPKVVINAYQSWRSSRLSAA